MPHSPDIPQHFIKSAKDKSIHRHEKHDAKSKALHAKMGKKEEHHVGGKFAKELDQHKADRRKYF